MIQAGSAACFLWALWVLILPAKWIVSAVLAALIHESCHVAAVRLLGGRVHRIQVGPFGAVIDADGITGLREAACALAGPFGSLLLVGLIHVYPILGLCSLVQACFNLLPVYPLDGGRALLRMMECLSPDRAESICRTVETFVLLMLFFIAIYLLVVSSVGVLPSVLCLIGIGRALLRKKP